MYHFCIKCVSVWVAPTPMADTPGLSQGMLVWVYSNKCPNCWMWTQRTCTDFPGLLASEAGHHVWSTRPALSPHVSCRDPRKGGRKAGRSWKWVGQSVFRFFSVDLLELEHTGQVCTLWQFSSLSAMGGARSFAFNITIFISFDLLFSF